MGLTAQERAFFGAAVKCLRELCHALKEAEKARRKALARARRIQGEGHEAEVTKWQKASRLHGQCALQEQQAKADVCGLVKVFFWTRVAAHLGWPSELVTKVKSFLL